MTPPTFQFPIDNLYKFIALSGVVLLVASVYLPFRAMSEFYAKSFQLIAEEQRSFTLHELWAASESIHDRRAMPLIGRLFEANDAEAEEIKKEFKELLDSHNADSMKKGSEADISKGTLAALSSEVKFLRLISRASFGLFVAMFGAGVWLMHFGFTRWYRLVQQYQDAILEADAKLKTTPVVPAPPNNKPHGSF